MVINLYFIAEYYFCGHTQIIDHYLIYDYVNLCSLAVYNDRRQSLI